MTGILIVLLIIGTLCIFLGPILETITFPVPNNGADLTENQNNRVSLKDKINLDDSFYQLFGVMILGGGIADLSQRLRRQKRHGEDITFGVFIDCLLGIR